MKPTTRQTKYCLEIQNQLNIHRHATNAELLLQLHDSFPKLSATTVHRATARLAERGLILIAPAAQDGSMRYDANIKPHDHFQCTTCGVLRDTDIREIIIPIIESSIDGCTISGRLTINGTCKQCNKFKEK